MKSGLLFVVGRAHPTTRLISDAGKRGAPVHLESRLKPRSGSSCKHANRQLKLAANMAGSTGTQIGLIHGGMRRFRLNRVGRLSRMTDWGSWEMSATHSAQWHNGGMT